MAEFTVVIGNKNYSSWSLRGWLMARIAGIEFEEILIPLDLPETQAAIRKHSPSGRVPVLLHRGLAIWESLAIAEYLNDLKPEAGLWPSSAAARAHARAISAEMHAGFAELRNNMPMNIRASYPGKGMTPGVRADIERITGLWRDCRKRFAGAFQNKDTTTDSGTRVLVRYSNVPAGARIFVPDVIAGSSAVEPTSGGDLGLPPPRPAAKPGLPADNK